MISKNRTHYIKYQLDLGEDYSIRYHFLWQGQEHKEKVYVLKHHGGSVNSIIEDKLALFMIKHHCTRITEVVASVEVTECKKRLHNKVVISDDRIESFRGGRDDVLIKSMKHRFDKEIV